MPEPLAFVNGELAPARGLSIGVNDAGFMLGTAVAEQVRTFGGKPFRLEAHLERLTTSLGILGVSLHLSMTDIGATAREVVSFNHALLDAADDLRLTILVTPGPLHLLEAGRAQPYLAIYTTPLGFAQWATKYSQGESLVTTDHIQVPARCWPVELKCRSRMHYYLADRQAHSTEPGSRALMLDGEGFVTEATTANILGYRQGVGLLTPPRYKILPGISLAMTSELAAEAGMPLAERDMRPEELAACDEVLLMSTSPCLLPVVRINGQAISGGLPGPIFQKLLSAWSGEVGLDIAAQALRFAAR